MAKVAEIRAVAALLSEPADSVDDLAAKVIDALDAERAKQRPYLAVILNPSLDICQAYGPFSTEKQVRKYAANLSRYDEHTRGWVGRLIHPE